MPPPDTPPALPAPWGEHELKGKGPVPLRIGPRDLWMEALEGEVRICHRDTPLDYTSPDDTSPDDTLPGDTSLSDPADIAPTPEDPGWSRWATPGGETTVHLVPSFPDRTLVLQPERPFRLLPHAEARIFVRIPLTVRFEVPLPGSVPHLFLTEIPAIRMSDTWWGDFMEGELTYWLNTKARRAIAPELHVRHMAVCALDLSNESSIDLNVDKLAFRVAHLSPFTDAEGRFWASESSVHYQGEALGSRIEISDDAPAEAGPTTLARGPRVRLPRGFRARTFERLRVLPGLGGSV